MIDELEKIELLLARERARFAQIAAGVRAAAQREARD